MELLSGGLEALAIGAIAGYFAGYLIKKLLQLAFIIGAFTFLLTYMSYTKAISINFEGIASNLKGYAEIALNQLDLGTLLSSSPFVGSFLVGLILSLKK